MKLDMLGVRQPFDLRRGPLLRVTLVTLSRTEQYLVIFAHLSILDGVSVYQILPSELELLYKAFAAGKTSPLKDLPLQYADYSYWHEQFLTTGDAQAQRNYWRQQMPGRLPLSHWTHQSTTFAFRSHRGALQPFTLRDDLRSALPKFSQSVGVTLFTTLAACLGPLIHSYRQEPKVLLLARLTPVPANGRRSRPARQLSQSHPAADRLQCRTLAELLRRTQEAVGAAVAHDEVPIEIPSQPPAEITGLIRGEVLPTIGISLQPKSAGTTKEWQVTSMDADSGGTIWDLYLAFIETPDGLIGRAQYSTHQFEKMRVSQVLSDLQEVMEVLINDLDAPATNWGPRRRRCAMI